MDFHTDGMDFSCLHLGVRKEASHAWYSMRGTTYLSVYATVMPVLRRTSLNEMNEILAIPLLPSIIYATDFLGIL